MLNLPFLIFRLGIKKVRTTTREINSLVQYGLLRTRIPFLLPAGLLTHGSAADRAFPLVIRGFPEMTGSDIMRSLSPFTALAQRYGFTPYSLFTAQHYRATPEEFLIDYRPHLSQKSKECKEPG
jgi:hypothetical protein